VLVGMEEVRQAVGGSGSGTNPQQNGGEACTAAAPTSLGAPAPGSRKGLLALGFLSPRMVFAGNLWQELWDRAEGIPAMDQPPLYDVEEGGQNSLAWLQDLAPSELLEQLFVTLLAIGLGSAHDLPEAAQEPLRTSLRECVRYTTAACCRGMGPAKQRWVCTVYRVMERARAAASTGAFPGVSQQAHLKTPLSTDPVIQQGRVSAGTGVAGAVSSPGHARCGAQQEAQEPPYLSLLQEGTQGHTGKSLVGCAAEEAPTAATTSLPVSRDAELSSQVCTPAAVPASYDTVEALLTPSEDPLVLSAAAAAAAAPCEERREDPSGIRQAAAAIFSKLRAGPGWSRPSVSWPNLEGAAAPFKAAEPAPSSALWEPQAHAREEARAAGAQHPGLSQRPSAAFLRP